MQARYYDPVIGRFYSNDPVGWTASSPVHSFGRYTYVNNNPYRYTDPNGKFPESWSEVGNLMIGVGTTIGGVAQGASGIALAAIGFADLAIGSKVAGSMALTGSAYMISASPNTMIEGMETIEAAWNNESDTANIDSSGPIEKVANNFGCSSSCVDTAKTIDKVAGAATGNVKSAVNLAGKTVEKMKAVGDATSQAKKINDLEER